MVDHQHWLDRWREDRIGFHEASVNRHLQNWFAKYSGNTGSRVFVPLCGKALDMLWIARQGFEVLGVELSEIAVEAFLDERIGFMDIPKVVGESLARHENGTGDLEGIYEADRWARETATAVVNDK